MLRLITLLLLLLVIVGAVSLMSDGLDFVSRALANTFYWMFPN